MTLSIEKTGKSVEEKPPYLLKKSPLTDDPLQYF